MSEKISLDSSELASTLENDDKITATATNIADIVNFFKFI